MQEAFGKPKLFGFEGSIVMQVIYSFQNMFNFNAFGYFESLYGMKIVCLFFYELAITSVIISKELKGNF